MSNYRIATEADHQPIRINLYGLATIDLRDGTVTVEEGKSVGEAAEKFWDYIQQMVGTRVPIPQSEQQAEMMAKLGYTWLKDHAPHRLKPQVGTNATIKALEDLLDRDQRNTCQHENTHRGGLIWEFCDECGLKWADDEGGKPEWKDPPEWEAAQVDLSCAQGDCTMNNLRESVAQAIASSDMCGVDSSYRRQAHAAILAMFDYLAANIDPKIIKQARKEYEETK